jgi:16S rRNA (uracil1498-N3)-methyltransferase
MEWAIEKAVELGCTRIIPVLAQRTDKHLTQAAEKRAKRWHRIALEAAKQSRRTEVPEITAPQRVSALIATAGRNSRRILLAETEQERTLLRSLRRPHDSTTEEILIAVGPEGGWTPAELKLFEEAGWQSASLGPRILRAETAAIAALSIAGAWHADESELAGDVPIAREPEADLP